MLKRPWWTARLITALAFLCVLVALAGPFPPFGLALVRDPIVTLVLGVILGAASSVAITVGLDRAARPNLILKAERTQARGELPGAGLRAFLHVVVENRREEPRDDLLPGLRPAWACSATLEVIAQAGSGAISPIPARWTSQPEPLVYLGGGGQLAVMPDVAKMLSGRRVDIHAHEPQKLSVVVKYEGEDACYLFTNESYAFLPKLTNDAWQLPIGRHRLRVTIAFERGYARRDFWVENLGSRLDDVRLVPFRAA